MHSQHYARHRDAERQEKQCALKRWIKIAHYQRDGERRHGVARDGRSMQQRPARTPTREKKKKKNPPIRAQPPHTPREENRRAPQNTTTITPPPPPTHPPPPRGAATTQ